MRRELHFKRIRVQRDSPDPAARVCSDPDGLNPVDDLDGAVLLASPVVDDVTLFVYFGEIVFTYYYCVSLAI